MNIAAAELAKPSYWELQQKLEEYRRAVKQGKATKDDRLILDVLNKQAKGLKVIDIREVFRAGGMKPAVRNLPSLPALAICEATAKTGEVYDRWDGWDFDVEGRSQIDGRSRRHQRVHIRHEALSSTHNSRGTWRAMVPTIPPAHRPEGGVSGLHMLWEAEWQPVAPKDPALLKRIGGPFFIVLAVWDLTALERAALSAARGL